VNSELVSAETVTFEYRREKSDIDWLCLSSPYAFGHSDFISMVRFNMTGLKKALVAIGILALPACGGGGSGDGGSDPVDVVYIALENPTSTAPNTLAGHKLEPQTGSLSQITGILDRASDRGTIDGQSGNINTARTSILLDAGGTITLNLGPTAFVTSYASQPSVGMPTFGVIGVGTAGSDMPITGTATLTGASGSAIQIIDGSAVYDLTGTTTAEVSFGNGGYVDLTFSNLNGTRTSGISGAVAVTDVATITIDDAVIAVGAFSGGTATFDSTQIGTALSGSEVVGLSGGFYGPDADEIGGVFIIDDTSGAGSLLLQGTFVAD
jgi:hypothetical protein